MFSVRPQIFSSVRKFLRLLQNRVQATHLFLLERQLDPARSRGVHIRGVVTTVVCHGATP